MLDAAPLQLMGRSKAGGTGADDDCLVMRVHGWIELKIEN
jgi:hypothetical protein